MNKKITITLIAGIVIVGGYFAMKAFTSKSPTTPYTSQTPDTTQTPVGSTSTEKTYTLADIAPHNSETSCWTAVAGGVYDVTTFIPSHPGGRQILKACGKDATALFASVRAHGINNASEVIKQYRIGTLQK